MPVLRRPNPAWWACLLCVFAVLLVLGVQAPSTAQVQGGLPPTPAVLVPTAVVGSTAPAPAAAGLATALDPIVGAPDLGGAVSAVVIDPATGTALYETDGATPRTPASTAKILTAVGVLAVLGPQARIPTTVVAGAQDDVIVLVGGGDPTLTIQADPAQNRPSLAALADAAAPAVTGPVRLVFDASLFAGPALAPGWGQEMVDSGFVGPVSALAVDQGRVSPDSDQRVSDPAATAAEAFAALLRERGVEVTAVEPGTAAAGAAEVARVESAPVADLVTTMLVNSDNDAAEMLAHRAGALSSGVGTFASGSEATLGALGDLGISVAGIELVDASGLSSDNRATARALAEVLALVAGPEHADISWPIGPGLAVAGFTGTLADRFVSEPSAMGIVRAKTGTLDGVSGLAGTLRDMDGRVLVFAVLANDVSDIYAARAALDTFAGTLVGCGCE